MRFQHISLNNPGGFSLIEMLVVVAIMTTIVAGVFTVIQTGHLSTSVATAELAVRAELRRAMDWLIKDVRQSRRTDFGNAANNPTSSHIKFQLVTGYVPASDAVSISPNVIEYTYDSNAKTMTRKETQPSGAAASWVFRYIEQAPFYTRTCDGCAPVEINANNATPVLQSGNLVIQLLGKKSFLNAVTSAFTLNEEVRMRN